MAKAAPDGIFDVPGMREIEVMITMSYTSRTATQTEMSATRGRALMGPLSIKAGSPVEMGEHEMSNRITPRIRPALDLKTFNVAEESDE